MKLSELPPHTNLHGVKIRIPDDFPKDRLHNLPTREVYLAGGWNLGIWVRTSPEATRIYPITEIDPRNILDWEVV